MVDCEEEVKIATQKVVADADANQDDNDMDGHLNEADKENQATDNMERKESERSENRASKVKFDKYKAEISKRGN
jgi:hypothetical protein